MSTAKDLFLMALDPKPQHPVGQGDLSLALAGAELIDLIEARTVTLDGDRIVPGDGAPVPSDGLLAEAASALTRRPPYERVEDWLWRRGRDLTAAYESALEGEGRITRTRVGRSPFAPTRLVPAGTPASPTAPDPDRHHSALTTLASLVGLAPPPPTTPPTTPTDDGGPGPGPGTDDATTTVLATVSDAVTELEAVRQRRSIENAAFANIWRAP
ncbi:GOLPH3/VPS74 family protein [Streptomyces antimicrobicus]|uniref:GPP34 family phosphoprotein n=1 Tax=Streptomyces antimicrobicus TaxID=2883108 RepID=A0ABS8BCR1_9ACTN|nr:GPP34 family phosphoprotein [Streptomyces antimicrobicus]MCB5182319.1 GPP34 family phosphoprotein [Streptomyces antimicrobicus]